jgi:hypothetical protein
MALTDGLVAQFLLEADANDSMGENHGTVTGAIQEPQGAGFIFDGINDFIEVPNDNSLNSNTGTISAWVKFSVGPMGSSNTGSEYLAMSVISKNDSVSSFNGWNLYIANSTPRLQIKGPSAQTVIASSGAALNDEEWHHIVVTFESGGTTSMFVDNSLVAESTNTVNFNVSSQSMRLAKNVDGFWDAFAGSIKDFRLWNRKISVAEILELYDGGGETMPELAEGKSKFSKSQDTTIISDSMPAGDVGVSKTSGDTGIFVYSELPYAIWFKSAGIWAQHQTFTSENLVAGSAFRWAPGTTHVYFQTSESEHTIYVFRRTGPLLIDNTPNNNDNVIDSLVLDPASTLSIFGTSDSSVTTATQHSISDATPITIEDGCDADVVVTEVVSDYTDSLSSKLAAYYKFEDNADDSGVAENHGTASAGCVYVAGKSGLGSALHQTVDSAHVALNNPDLMNLGANFTVAAWVYIPSSQTVTGLENPWNDISVFGNIDAYGDWTYISGFNLAVGKPGYAGGWSMPSNSLNFYSGCGQGNGIYSWSWFAVGTPQNSFPYDEWVHIAVTANSVDQAAWGSNIKLFINGQSQTLDPRSDQPTQNPMEWPTNPLTTNLGATWRITHPDPMATSGELKYDEIAIWKRELSESEISDLYNLKSSIPVGSETSLVAQYECANNVDEVSANNVTLTNNAASASSEDRTYWSFPDANSAAVPASPITFDKSTGYTISFMFKGLKDKALAETGWMQATGYFPNGAAPASGEQYYDFAIYTAGELVVADHTQLVSSGYAMNMQDFQQWTHIAAVYDGTQTTFYINGDQVGNPCIWGGSPGISTIQSSTSLSADRDYNYAFADEMDSFYVWDRPLTASEIKDLATSGNELDTSYTTTETVRSDFTVQKQVVVTAPAGTDTTNIKVEITK